MANGQPYDPIMEEYIQECRLRVAKNGFEGSDTKEVILAGFGYLADRLAPRNDKKFRQKAAQATVPTITAGGILAIVFYAIQLLAK